MHHGLTLLILAIAAGLTMAAPTPTKELTKRSFKVPVKGHKKLSPAKAMARAYSKYGWDSPFQQDHQDPWAALESYLAGHGYGDQASSSAPVWGGQSSGVWVWGSSAAFGFPTSTAPASASASAFFSGFPSSQAGPSSSAPVQAPSSQPFAPSQSAPPPVSSAPAGGFSSSAAPPPPQSSGPSGGPSSSAAASAPAPSSPQPSGGSSEEGSVSATPDQNEAAYISPVSIGGQTLDLDFDTGSSDLWVFNSQMSSSETSGHKIYDPTKSSTFTKYSGGSWAIQYGDGSTAQGDVGFDKVEIGGVVAQKQCIELAQQVSGSFLQDDFMDGLLGLAFSTINQVQPQQQKTFFENVMGDLDQPLFTADLEENASGTYEFGNIDSSKHTGDINYAPVDNSMGFWMIQSETYSIGGASHQCSTCSPTIADTGTSLLIWDNDVVAAYYQQVQGAQLSQGTYLYPCSETLPDFGVAIGSSYVAVVKGADMKYATADQAGTTCFGGLQPNGGGSTAFNIIGDVLLKQFFAVFDGGNMQFGVAPKP